MALEGFASHWALFLTPLLMASSSLLACSSSNGVPKTGGANLSGGSIVVVKSAALIQSGAVTEAGIGAPSTYVQFFGNAPGASCSALDASSIEVAGSLSILVDPSTLAGKTFTFGAAPDPVLSLNAMLSADASMDASFEGGGDDGSDGGTGAPLALVAVAGTVKFSEVSGQLTGTIDAQMVLASSPGSTPAEVTGTFTAPSCSDY